MKVVAWLLLGLCLEFGYVGCSGLHYIQHKQAEAAYRQYIKEHPYKAP